jgi:ubiquitin C-terminal hydrolase
MIHNGGAQAGHYSAYIKDFNAVRGQEKNENCWYHFNDTHVKKISVTDLVDAFGKPQNTKGRRFTAANDSNAYMLMYRLILPPAERIYSIADDMIPSEVQEEVLK